MASWNADFEDGTVFDPQQYWFADDTITPGTRGAYSGNLGDDNESLPNQYAVATPSELSGGVQITQFEFYWAENSNSTGGGVQLINSNGTVELTMGSNNPQWQVGHANGNESFYGGDGYSRWIRFTVTFNWGANEFTIDGEDTQSGATASLTESLNAGVDVEKIAVGGAFTVNATHMWLDDFYAESPQPDAPSDVEATVNADDATATWNDNSTNEDGFHVDRYYDGSWTRVADLGANTTTYDDTGLLDGEQYRYRVRAYNTNATSDWSYSNYVTTTLPAPSAASLSIDDPTTATASWNDNSDNENNFRVQVSEDGGAWTDVGTPSGTSFQFSISKSADSIQARVRAETEHTTSGYATTAALSTNASVAVTDERETELDLSISGGDQADEYHVYRAESSGSTLADYSLVGSPTTTPYTDAGLEAGERYYYRVAAVYGGVEDEASAEVSGTTTVPAPVLDNLDTSTDREVALAWTLSDNSTDGNVVVERRRAGDGGSFSDVATLAADATTHTDTGLDDGERYEYRIRRETDHASATSDVATARTNLPAPTNATDSNVTEDSADLAWTDNHNYGQTRVDLRPTTPDGEPDEPWAADATYGLGVEAHTFTGLKNGEEYEWRVVAVTEHTETEDI